MESARSRFFWKSRFTLTRPDCKTLSRVTEIGKTFVTVGARVGKPMVGECVAGNQRCKRSRIESYDIAILSTVMRRIERRR